MKTMWLRSKAPNIYYLALFVTSLLSPGFTDGKTKLQKGKVTRSRSQTMQEMQETWGQSLGGNDPLEEDMLTHSSMLAWRIPWTEEPGGLQSMGAQRVGHNRNDLAIARPYSRWVTELCLCRCFLLFLQSCSEPREVLRSPGPAVCELRAWRGRQMDACALDGGPFLTVVFTELCFVTFYLGISKHTTEFREYSCWFLYIFPPVVWPVHQELYESENSSACRHTQACVWKGNDFSG